MTQFDFFSRWSKIGNQARGVLQIVQFFGRAIGGDENWEPVFWQTPAYRLNIRDYKEIFLSDRYLWRSPPPLHVLSHNRKTGKYPKNRTAQLCHSKTAISGKYSLSLMRNSFRLCWIR